MKGADWIRAFEGAAGVALEKGELEQILDLIVAVESGADPVAAAAACVLVERAGRSLEEGVLLAKLVTAWDDSWG